MRPRRILYRREALADLREIRSWITLRVSAEFAKGYLRRIRARLHSLETGSERGSLRDDIGPGLRAIGLMPSVSVVFVIKDDRVVILRVLYGGQDWRVGLPVDELDD